MSHPSLTDFFVDNLQEKEVYYFKNNKPDFNSDDPHYFICMKRTEGDLLILTCCTTQFEKRKNFIESRNLPLTTLVPIKSDGENGLKEDSFVDCNSCFFYDVEEFRQLHLNNEITFKGNLSRVNYEQILIGLHDSPRIEGTTKDMLPPKPE